MGIGRHLLADFYGVAPERLRDGALLTRCLVEGAARARLTPVAPPALHRFEGGGWTGVVLLSESHIAFHTYPEHGYVAVDVFSCGAGRPEDAVAVFRAALAPERESLVESERGAALAAR